MKIAIIGSHGTGKSTLAEYVHEQTGLPRIQEVARDLIGELGKTPQQMSKEELISFQKKIYQRQVASEVGDFVSDRGIYDNIAYAKEVDDSLYSELMGKAKLHTGYDLVFLLCPGEFDIDDDGVRFTDPLFQKKIHNNILEIIDLLGIETIQLKGSVEERYKKMRKYF